MLPERRGIAALIIKLFGQGLLFTPEPGVSPVE